LSEYEQVRREVDEENNGRVESMSAEEREQEAEELKERFGAGIVELMRKRREAREAGKFAGTGTVQAKHHGQAEPSSQRTMVKGMGEVERTYSEVDVENRNRVEGMNAEEKGGETSELEERFGGRSIEPIMKSGEATKNRERPGPHGNEGRSLVNTLELTSRTSFCYTRCQFAGGRDDPVITQGKVLPLPPRRRRKDRMAPAPFCSLR
jgi:hypothetical protein